MMDKPAIHAAEAFVNAGYPLDVEALLIVELDGPAVEVDYLIERVRAIAARNAARASASRTSERERLAFWAGRKSAFPAVGRISPDYYCMDGTIPRRAAAARASRDGGPSQALRPTRRECLSCRRRQSASAHPVRRQRAGRARTAEEFGIEILKLCVDVGGVLTGEHGVGLEKRDLMTYQFDATDLEHPTSREARVRSRGAVSIRARCSRRCTVAPSRGASTFMRGRALPPLAAVLAK